MYTLSHLPAQDLVEVVTRGDLDADAFFEMIGKTRDLCAQTDATRVLVDHSRASVGGVPHEGIRAVADYCTLLNRVLAGGRLAVVLIADLDYGLGRVWLSYAEEMLAYESRLFRNRREAELWLLASRAKDPGDGGDTVPGGGSS
ncbi:MAG: hypothetical protein DWQ36_12880 [Acidobacteria bacterium]|nr:MAG: hypothetical protein DWQ30_04810 [Acidobacteriota bacterium]REK07095.1 MAG: hypothetical protein DWQ36_12880 [Acidobacteriota bacterium]